MIVEATLKPMSSQSLRLARESVQIPIREYPDNFDCRKHWNNEHFRYAYENWPKIIADQSPVAVKVNVIRVGDAVICTKPAELYVEFGLEIKKRSPVRITLIAELTDGHCGYVATFQAYDHGGYSTGPRLAASFTSRQARS